ncbi:alpha/beta fold hydrolase [Bradyrhizobium japonicum]|uniref:alpha/beta fold hydrolase n=1 Tax=Bradyrhizobium japonicum TaxID=375 RepID=UPI001BA724A6|nr:alpha/beta hydrolase [Bradyrhizobium japonicum]MBR0911763.1 alpha/beta hydrolase [Bradyrhizobium japonicum]
MTNNLRLEPVLLTRDGVRLAHFEGGPSVPDSPPLLFINGWTGDHRIFTPQIAHFAERRRVVATNLRGHGASDAPQQEYTLPGFADDIAWQCSQLGLQKPVVIGHSLGGAIALELCVRYPELAFGLMMIDSPVTAPPALRKSPEIQQWLNSISGPDYPTVSRAGAWDIACDFDDPARRKAIYDEYILPPCEKTPQHVAFSTISNFIQSYDQDTAADACKIPMAYISTDVPSISMGRFLDRLQERCPHLVTAKTLLSGHFNTIEVADQVNAMIERFLAVGLRRTRSSI